MDTRGLVSFDPAAHHVAWAAFYDSRLRRCGLIRENIGATLEDKFRCTGSWEPMRYVIELPQVYGRRGGGGDPNDLIAVALTVGRIVQALGPATTPELIRPHGWKGNVKKSVMLDRIKNRLDAEEVVALHTAKAPASLLHNVIDAIGVGLWATGRLG